MQALTVISMSPEIKLHDFFKYFQGGDAGQPQQSEAVQLLQSAMPESLLLNSAAWVMKFRESPPEPEIKPGPVTPELMSRYSGHGQGDFDQAFCDDFNELLSITKFDTDLTAFRMLLAQMAHESVNWKYMKEISDGWYLEGRCSDLGNCSPGDGPKFRGCGPIQITGKFNHTAANKLLKELYKIDDPKVMEVGTDYTADHYAFRFCTAWIIENDYFNLCRTGDVVACTRRLNGGTNGLADREHWYSVACNKIHQSDLI